MPSPQRVGGARRERRRAAATALERGAARALFTLTRAAPLCGPLSGGAHPREPAAQLGVAARCSAATDGPDSIRGGCGSHLLRRVDHALPAAAALRHGAARALHVCAQPQAGLLHPGDHLQIAFGFECHCLQVGFGLASDWLRVAFGLASDCLRVATIALGSPSDCALLALKLPTSHRSAFCIQTVAQQLEVTWDLVTSNHSERGLTPQTHNPFTSRAHRRSQPALWRS